MSEQVMVQTRDLTKSFGDFVALHRLSFSLERGEILGFIGPNGAGKTTTIRILVGLSRPTSGTATIAGVDCVSESRRIRGLVGYMPDTFGGYDNMRVREYLDFFGAAFKIPRKQRLRRIEEVLDTTGSAYMKDLFVESLSHGMKQRVGIARTLLHNPQVLILDEPANGLDPQARIEMRQILLRLAEMGKTLIVTSHILPELARICDKVAIITRGKLAAFGSLEQIMRKVRQRRVMELQLASPQHVAIAADVIRSIDPEAEVEPSTREAEVRFATRATDAVLAEYLRALVAKLPVVQFREVPLDLEDAFLEVTRTASSPGDGEQPGKAAGAAGTAEASK